MLEEHGLLAHPHTSAGRVPTDAGYRYYVDELLPRRAPCRAAELRLELVRREVDEAMRVTTETLSQVTNLLAIVSAPPIETTTIRHIEVLALQPQVLMVVIITSTGGVSKRVFTFERAGRPRPRRVGGRLPQRAARRHGARRADAALAARRPVAAPDRARVPRPSSRPRSPSWPRPPRTRSTSTARARLLSEHRFQDVSQLNELLEAARAPRVAARRADRRARRSASIYVRIGAENADAGAAVAVAGRRQLRAAAAQPRHRLGDRADADGLRAARSAPCARPPPAVALHRRRLQEGCHAARLLRGPRRRPRRGRGRDQEGVPPARARAAPGRQRPRPRGRGASSRRPPRPTRCSRTPSAAASTTPTATRA